MEGLTFFHGIHTQPSTSTHPSAEPSTSRERRPSSLGRTKSLQQCPITACLEAGRSRRHGYLCTPDLTPTSAMEDQGRIIRMRDTKLSVLGSPSASQQKERHLDAER